MALIDDKTAVEDVCRIGKAIEEGLDKAESEAFLRSWKPAPDGGHDPEAMRVLR